MQFHKALTEAQKMRSKALPWYMLMAPCRVLVLAFLATLSQLSVSSK